MGDDATDNLPAEQKDAMLAIRTDNLPDARPMAIANVTEVLPEAAFIGIGGLANTLTPDQVEELEKPLPDDDIEIRPEGLVYATHSYYRQKLNKVFGHFGWTLRPMSPLKNRLDKTSTDESEWYRVWALYINGCYVAVAMDSYTLREKNKRMDLSDVDQAIQSGCLKRCCKDFLAPELYDRRWRQKKMKELGVQVVVKTWKGNETQWRRKDEDPLEGEISAAPKAQPVRGDAEKTPKAAEQPSAGNSPSHAPASAAPGVRRGPTLNPAQVNLVFARARAAGLVVGDDASKLVELLMGAGVPQGDVKLITMSELKVILPAIDAHKSTDTERI